MDLQNTDGPRLRTLTDKAQQEYQQKVEVFSSKIYILRRNLEGIITEIGIQKEQGLGVESLTQELITAQNCFEQSVERFMEFLQRVRTQESCLELASQKFIFRTMAERTNVIIKDIERQQIVPGTILKESPCDTFTSATQQDKLSDTQQVDKSYAREEVKRASSQVSRSRSRNSSTSSANSIRLQQKAKAKAARVRFQFAKEEASILRQQAEREAQHQKENADTQVNLKLLKSQRDLEEAEAELEVFNEMLDNEMESEGEDMKSVLEQRTEKYVTGLQRPTVASNYEQQPQDSMPQAYQFQNTPLVKRNFHTVPSVSDTCIVSQFHPEEEEFIPTGIDKPKSPPVEYQTPFQESGVTVLTKYIMKKELILSRLSQFNDKPERYFVWKASFNKVSKELDINSTEELDLLCKWLGPESSAQANSLRAANCSNEEKAVRKIWERLDSRYGAPELVVNSLQERLQHFPKLSVKDCAKMYELSDLPAEIESLKEDRRYATSLAFLDSSSGVNPIANKLPTFMQGKWTDRAMRYKADNNVLYPPFSVFSDFILNMAVRLNDPGFKFDPNPTTKSSTSSYAKKDVSKNQPSANRLVLSARKTEVVNQDFTEVPCPMHGETSKHIMRDCRIFQAKSIQDKKEAIKKYGICFKCCTGKHLAKDCREKIKCQKCGSAYHCTAFHVDRETSASHGGEPKAKNIDSERGIDLQVDTNCTQICGNSFKGKSCAKTVLVNVYRDGRPEDALKVYAIIDDQSNRTLARSEFFEHFSDNSDEVEYILSSCAGRLTTSGRQTTGYVIESLDGTSTIKCPTLIECNEIPNVRQEIPTPAVARHYSHLQDIEQCIPEYDPNAPTLLLIGRDMISAHHVLDQRLGFGEEPYAQRLRLGWVIVGETCLGRVHRSDTVTVNKTHVLQDGRKSQFQPCPNGFELKNRPQTNIGYDVFQSTPEDDESGLSREDREFFRIMEDGFTKSTNGNWSAPLPFRKDRPVLPNNYHQARQRAENLAKGLKRDPTKQEHFVEFMGKIFDNKHAEEAPPMQEGEERWYLPIFSIYHPKKPTKIRVVFDSSAKHNGISLNDVLLSGPDLTNNLV